MPGGGVTAVSAFMSKGRTGTRYETPMSDAPMHRPDEADLDAALAWYEALQDPQAGAPQWQAFTEWLEARPEHRLAFDRVEELHATLEHGAPQILALLREPENLASASANDNRRWWRSGKAAIGAAALIAASLVLLWLPDTTRSPGQQVAFEAPPGQIRALSLADGTHLDLSPGSRIEIRIDAAARRLRLDRGDVLVRVAHDPQRPLVLLASDLAIRDIGTVFDVSMKPGQLAVTVISGLVVVAAGPPNGTAQQAVQLSAGQQLLHTPGAAGSRIAQVDPASALSWRNGFLTYRDAPLSDVVADINRNFAAHVTVADAATGARRFSGVLKAESLDATLRRLSVLLALPVIQRGDAVQLGAAHNGR
jgi:transmembrane sensor